MIRLFLVAICSIIISGCSGGNSPDPGTAKTAAKNVVYSKDDRTNLCFGFVTSTSYAGYNVVSITNVPCKEVEHLLVK